MSGSKCRKRTLRVFYAVAAMVLGTSTASGHEHPDGLWHTHQGGGISALDYCKEKSCESLVEESTAPEVVVPWVDNGCNSATCEGEIQSRADWYSPGSTWTVQFHTKACPDGSGGYIACNPEGYSLESDSASEKVCGPSNPCNPVDGNKYQTEVDFEPTGESVPRFRRYYNSLGSYRSSGDIGAGWRHTYSRSVDEPPDQHKWARAVVREENSKIYATPAEACTQGWDDIKASIWSGTFSAGTATYAGGDVCTISSGGSEVAYMPVRSSNGWSGYTGAANVRTVTRPDGTAYRFKLVGSVWESAFDGSVSLELSGGDWIFTDQRDTRETYDGSGRLLSITQRNGQAQTLDYDLTVAQGGDGDSTTLDKVTGDFGHELTFDYDANGRISTVTTPDGSIQFAYDADSNLTSVTYPDATSRQYLYEDEYFENYLTGITDENGVRFSTWAYDVDGRAILSERAGGKRRVEFAYNTDGTTTETMGDGSVRTYNFTVEQGRQRLDSVTGDVCGSCPGGNTKSKDYDANGYVSERTDWNNHVTQYVRNSRGLIETLTEAAGTSESRVTTTQWHTSYRLPTKTTSPKNVTDYVYDIDGNLTSLTISSGSLFRAWTLTYNADSQPLTIDGPRTDVVDVTTLEYHNCATGNECGQLKKITNALGHATTFDAYDSAGRPTSMTDPNGLTTTMVYDNRGRVVSTTVTPVAGTPRVTTRTYTNAGQLATVNTPDGMILTYAYTDAQYLASVTDNFGNSIAYDYDAMGRQSDEDVYDPQSTLTRTMDYVTDLNDRLDTISAAGYVTDLDYDLVGNLTQETDANSEVTQYAYDALDRLTTVTDALTGATSYSYDAHDNITQVVSSNAATTTFTYDDLDNQHTESSPDRGLITYTYDAAGNVKTMTDARGKVTSYDYDALDRLALETLDGGGTIAYEYDVGTNAKGRLNKITDSTGTTTWTYDGFGAVASKTQTIGSVALTVSYAYDASGRLSSVTLPSGKVVAYGYNTYLPDSVSVDGTTILSGVTYDPFGPVTGWTWGNGSTHSRAYDLRGLMTSQDVAWTDRTLTYDSVGDITSIDDAAMLRDYGYDALGRLTTYDAEDLSAASSRWLALAEVSAPNTAYLDMTTVTGGADFTWSPAMPTTPGTYEFRLFEEGTFNRIATSASVTVTTATTPPATYIDVSSTRVAPGETITATMQNGPGNASDWMATYSVGASNLSYLRWSYVGNGNTTYAWNVMMPTSTGDYEVRLLENNGYNDLATSSTVSVMASPTPVEVDVSRTTAQAGETVTATVDVGSAGTPPATIANDSYAYDANGNRSQLTLSGTPYGYSIQVGSNRLLSTAGPTAKTFTYDAAGNITSDGLFAYGYDDRGRMVTVGSTTTYEHNGQGQRVKKDNGTVTLFVYDEFGQLLGEYDSTGTAVLEHVWFNGAPVAVLSGSDRHYVHSDHLGTPRAVTDGNTVIWSWESDPFGSTLANEDPDGDANLFTYNLRFPGQYFDWGTGLHYNYFRSYDPFLGRYLRSDPIGLQGGSNSYAYVSNAPTVLTDRLGLYEGDGTDPYFGDDWDRTYHPDFYRQRDDVVPISGSIGAGGAWHGGPGGVAADSGIALGSEGAFCIYSRLCGSFGMGAFATLGLSGSGAVGRLCSGSYKTFGIAGGGGAVGAGGSSIEISHDLSGLSGARGIGGIGVGGYGAYVECSYTLICFNESEECRGCGDEQ